MDDFRTIIRTRFAPDPIPYTTFKLPSDSNVFETAKKICQEKYNGRLISRGQDEPSIIEFMAGKKPDSLFDCEINISPED